MKTKLICGFIALLVIFGCGGAGGPYVPDNGGPGAAYTLGGTGTQTITQGQSADFHVSVLDKTGQINTKTKAPDPVTLSVSGLPNNSTSSFSTNPVPPTNPAADVTLTVQTQATTTAGTYTLTVVGDDGSSQQSTAFTLIVNAVAAGPFTLDVQTVDGTMTNGNGGGAKGLITDSTADYNVTVHAPAGYVGQARLEWRFVDQNAPSGNDVKGTWHFGQSQSADTLTYGINASNETDSAELTLNRVNSPIPTGDFGIEFKVIPLVNGFAPATRSAFLTVNFENGQRPRKH